MKSSKKMTNRLVCKYWVPVTGIAFVGTWKGTNFPHILSFDKQILGKVFQPKEPDENKTRLFFLIF